MLKAFIDDSGSEPNSPTYVLAGYVLPAEAWMGLSDDWEKELPRGKPILYLHMCETGKHVKDGQFVGWKPDEIDDKLLPLATIIERHQPIGLRCYAPWSEYQKFAKNSTRAQFLPDPYKALFYEVIKLMYGYGERVNNLQPVNFIFDDQGPIGDEAVSWYRDIKEAFPPGARPFFGSTPGFGDDKREVALQAADMFAWYTRRHICHPVSRPKQKQVAAAISQFVCAESELNAEAFENAATDFEKVAGMRRAKSAGLIPQDFKSFDEMMSKLLSVPHSELKAKVDAEKAVKAAKKKLKKEVASR